MWEEVLLFLVPFRSQILDAFLASFLTLSFCLRPYQFFSLLSVSGRVGFEGPDWQKTNKWIWTKSGKFMSVIFNAIAYPISVAQALALMVSLVHIFKALGQPWTPARLWRCDHNQLNLIQRKGTIESWYYRGGSILTKGGMHDMSSVQ